MRLIAIKRFYSPSLISSKMLTFRLARILKIMKRINFHGSATEHERNWVGTNKNCMPVFTFLLVHCLLVYCSPLIMELKYSEKSRGPNSGPCGTLYLCLMMKSLQLHKFVRYKTYTMLRLVQKCHGMLWLLLLKDLKALEDAKIRCQKQACCNFNKQSVCAKMGHKSWLKYQILQILFLCKTEHSWEETVFPLFWI